MINYCVQSLSFSGNLAKGLEYVVPKDMGKSSKINKDVRTFCKVSPRVERSLLAILI